LPHKTLTRIPALDGLRGLAALAVLVPHFFNHWDIQSRSSFNPFLRIVYDRRGYGGYGVDVFFVLSGFLISSLLIADRDSPSFFHDFYWKRVLRILPVYFVHLALSALFFDHWQSYVLLSLVFLVNFAGSFHMKVVGPAWTLSIEEQFYLLWPHAIKRLRPPSLYYLAFCLVVGCNVLRLVIPLVHGTENPALTFYRCDGLALGSLIAFQLFLPPQQSRFIRLGVALLKSNVTLLVTMSVAVIVMILRDQGSILSRQIQVTAVNLLIYRLVCFIVFQRGRGLGWLGSWPLVYLGSISYALYMFQGFVIDAYERAFGHIPASDGAAIFLRIALVLATCLVICSISRYALELPAQRLRRFVIHQKKPDAVLLAEKVEALPSASIELVRTESK
jgi:peptidoglycan/LPS O-acetylase OafA/YrhL